MLAVLAFEMHYRLEKLYCEDPCPCCGLWSQKGKPTATWRDWRALPLPLFAWGACCAATAAASWELLGHTTEQRRRLWRPLCPLSGEGSFCCRSVSLCFIEASLCFHAVVQKGCSGLRGCGHPRPLGWIPARDFGQLRSGGRGRLDCLFAGGIGWTAWGRLDWQFAGRSACWLSCWFRGGSACSLLGGGSLDWVLVSREAAWLRDCTCYAGGGSWSGWGCLRRGSCSGRGCRLTSGGGAVVGTELLVLQPLDCKIMDRLLMVTTRPSIPHLQVSQSRLEQVRCGGQA